MPDLLPDAAPLIPEEKRLRLVVPSDGPSAASLAPGPADTPAPPPVSAAPAYLTAGAIAGDDPADSGTVSAGAPADDPAVSVSQPVSVADTSLTPVTDADAADGDAGTRLPGIVPFGEEINPATLFILTAARATMSITTSIAAAGVKGAAKSGAWTAPPKSPGDHHAWINDTRWIPGDYEDEGMIKFLVFLRKTWGWLFGMPFTVLGNTLVHLRRPQVALAASIGIGLFYMFVVR